MAIESPADWNNDRIVAETFVRDVEVHESLPSTNDHALQLATDDAIATPRLIIAEKQTKGRGRGANIWWSSAGSLTFSLLLNVDPQRLPTSRWPEMSLTVGTSICSAVAQLLPGEDVRLKWPNDVFLRGRKLSGVLVEIPPRTSGRIVIGIGINVNNSIQNAPEELRETAIALCDANAEVSRQDVLISSLQEFDRQLGLLIDQPDAVRRLWRKFDLLTGRSVTISDGLTDATGTCTGIDDDGALLLRNEVGTRRCYGGVVQMSG